MNKLALAAYQNSKRIEDYSASHRLLNKLRKQVYKISLSDTNPSDRLLAAGYRSGLKHAIQIVEKTFSKQNKNGALNK